MAAYLVVYSVITDPKRFQEYAQASGPIVQRYGGRMITAAMPDVVEGEWPWELAAVFEWPSREDALCFWNSEEYAQVRKLREGAAQFQAIIVDSNPQS